MLLKKSFLSASDRAAVSSSASDCSMMFHLCKSVLLAKIGENAILPRVANCVVSYLDTEGFRHSVEVQAETLYEAAVLGVRAFAQHQCAPGELSKLEVEIRSAVVHEVTLKKVRQWLNGGARSPKDAVLKERSRALL